MLPWYIGSMLFQHTNHLSLLHNVFQILHHILEKRLKSCMLLQHLHYKISPFQKKYIQVNQIFIESIMVYKILETVKIQGYCEPFNKLMFDCIFLGCNWYYYSSTFFGPAQVFKSFADCIPWSNFFSHFFSLK